MNYVCILPEPGQKLPYQSTPLWLVYRWVDGHGTSIGRKLNRKEAETIAQNADGVPVRDWVNCIVCAKPWPESFMVRTSVWHEAKLGRGLIHIECLQSLLGRRLTPDDFDLKLPINSVLAFGFQMGKDSETRKETQSP